MMPDNGLAARGDADHGEFELSDDLIAKIKCAVDNWPPLSAAQGDALGALFSADRGDAT
jgi:hypothetical protein